MELAFLGGSQHSQESSLRLQHQQTVLKLSHFPCNSAPAFGSTSFFLFGVELERVVRQVAGGAGRVGDEGGDELEMEGIGDELVVEPRVYSSDKDGLGLGQPLHFFLLFLAPDWGCLFLQG